MASLWNCELPSFDLVVSWYCLVSQILTLCLCYMIRFSLTNTHYRKPYQIRYTKVNRMEEFLITFTHIKLRVLHIAEMLWYCLFMSADYNIKRSRCGK